MKDTNDHYLIYLRINILFHIIWFHIWTLPFCWKDDFIGFCHATFPWVLSVICSFPLFSLFSPFLWLDVVEFTKNVKKLKIHLNKHRKLCNELS
jgi:hypothetical protein